VALSANDIHPAEPRFTSRGPAFNRLEDAKQYVRDQRATGSFALRRPDGRWHSWAPSDAELFDIPTPRLLASGRQITAVPMGYPPGVPFGKFRK
jgi:hypothetical protein